MKKDIHPPYKNLRIKIGNDVFETMSCYRNDEILMDVDFRKHPAWTKKGMTSANESNESVSNFNKKFAGFDFKLS